MKRTFPLSSPPAPENARRFAPAQGRVADLFERFLAVESLVNRPIEDDLHLGRTFAALPPPPVQDRMADPDDDGEGDAAAIPSREA